jgi:hypothetical protein
MINLASHIETTPLKDICLETIDSLLDSYSEAVDCRAAVDGSFAEQLEKRFSIAISPFMTRIANLISSTKPEDESRLKKIIYRPVHITISRAKLPEKVTETIQESLDGLVEGSKKFEDILEELEEEDKTSTLATLSLESCWEITDTDHPISDHEILFIAKKIVKFVNLHMIAILATEEVESKRMSLLFDHFPSTPIRLLIEPATEEKNVVKIR